MQEQSQGTRGWEQEVGRGVPLASPPGISLQSVDLTTRACLENKLCASLATAPKVNSAALEVSHLPVCIFQAFFCQ